MLSNGMIIPDRLVIVDPLNPVNNVGRCTFNINEIKVWLIFSCFNYRISSCKNDVQQFKCHHNFFISCIIYLLIYIIKLYINIIVNKLKISYLLLESIYRGTISFA